MLPTQAVAVDGAFAGETGRLGFMPLLLALIGYVTPRVVIVVLALFTDYLSRAFDGVLWPILGFIFLPVTTLAWTFAQNADAVRGGGRFVLVVVAVLVDVGLIGGGRSRLARGGRDVGSH